ncbi:hypothetical protein VP01_2500g1 [Puccinia sorghi]|uniref:Uncharacterized protein n=1 Tax=Puccinia sorghi TaxID=27349 RepID=A0A0L6V7H9_9BASI|nr:hypothetical protein VP01_2500g1 [Puccinia sorghi]
MDFGPDPVIWFKVEYVALPKEKLYCGVISVLSYNPNLIKGDLSCVKDNLFKFEESLKKCNLTLRNGIQQGNCYWQGLSERNTRAQIGKMRDMIKVDEQLLLVSLRSISMMWFEPKRIKCRAQAKRVILLMKFKLSLVECCSSMWKCCKALFFYRERMNTYLGDHVWIFLNYKYAVVVDDSGLVLGGKVSYMRDRNHTTDQSLFFEASTTSCLRIAWNTYHLNSENLGFSMSQQISIFPLLEGSLIYLVSSQFGGAFLLYTSLSEINGLDEIGFRLAGSDGRPEGGPGVAVGEVDIRLGHINPSSVLSFWLLDSKLTMRGMRNFEIRAENFKKK